MYKLPVLLILLGFASARFDLSSSDSGSCEDSHEHSGGGGGGHNHNGCGHGWRRFNRHSGGWCMRVFSGEMSQADAESKCKSQGATLSGLKDESEIRSITARALRIFSPKTSGSIWVGAKRTSECSTSPISSTCTPSNSFVWTDAVTTGTSGFLWNLLQPDNAHAKTQQCLVLLASSQSVVQDKWTWNANRLDDVACVSPGGSEQRIVRGYLCGKKAGRS